MAATDTKLNIGVTTSGVESIRKLAEEVRALAQQGGESGQAFKQFADEIDRIATTTEAVQRVGALTEELSELRQKQDAAATSAQEYRARLEELNASVVETKEDLAQSNLAFREAQRETQAARDAITSYRKAQDSATVNTKEYRDQIQVLTNALLESRERQRQAAAAIDESKAKYEKAKQEVKDFKEENKGVEKALREAENAVKKKAASLDAQANSLRKAGVETLNFESATDQLRNALAQVSQQVVTTRTETERLAAIERAVAESNERNVAIAQRAARERAIIQERNAAAARSTAQAEREAAQAAKESAEALRRSAAEAEAAFERAFAVTGVRSTRLIEGEIREINAALARLRSDTTITGAEFDRAFRAGTERIRKLEDELNGVSDAARRTTQSFGFLRQGFQQFAAAYGVFEAGRAFIDANVQLETLRRTMTLVTGSTEAAAEQIELLRKVADQAGVPIGSISNSFVKFQTSARLAGVEANTINEVFSRTVNAAGQLNISGERVSLMLDALSQIASKGTVSMEELRQQLGDSLPGALGITARGLGVTEKQLVKLVESGQLLAEDFLPAFSNGLRQTFGDGNTQVEGFIQSWARLRNAVRETFTFIGESGVFAALTTVLSQAAIAVRGLTAAFELLGSIIGQTLGFIATFDWRRPIESVRQYAASVSSTADELQAKLDSATNRANSQAKVLADGQAAIGDSAQRAGQQATEAAAGFDANAQAAGKAAQAAQGLAQAQQGAGAEVDGAGAKARNASGGWVALTVAYNDAAKRAEEFAVQSTKLAEAKKIEGETAVALAELSGNEVEVRRVAAEAAAETAAALDRAAAARQSEVDVLIAQRDALRAEGEAQGGLSNAKQEAIGEIERTIAAKTAEAAKSREVADASRQEAAEARIAAQVYGDNSARLDEYRSALERTRAELLRVRQAYADGRATQEQVVDATRRTAEAEALYRDSIEDTEKALKRRITTLGDNNDIVRAGLGLKLEEAKTAEAVANANQNELAAIAAKIRQKEIEIQIVKLAAESKKKEAAEIIRTYTELIREGEATGTITAEKRAEYESRIANAKAKQIEAGASIETIKQIEAEIAALRRRAAESGNVRDKYIKDRNSEKDSVEDLRESVESLTKAESERRNMGATYDSQNFATNAQGNRISAAGATWLSIFNQLKSRGLSEDEARSLAEEFAPNGKVQYFNNTAQRKYGGDFSTIDFAVDRAAEQVIRNRSGQGGTGGFVGLRQAGDREQTGGSGARTVNININGRPSSVRVASDSDAQTLERILRQLSEDQSRVG